jgi:hypothetical protein
VIDGEIIVYEKYLELEGTMKTDLLTYGILQTIMGLNNIG